MSESNVTLQLARIEVKLDQALATGQDHEIRLRSLERARWPLPALAIVVSVGAGITEAFQVISH